MAHKSFLHMPEIFVRISKPTCSTEPPFRHQETESEIGQQSSLGLSTRGLFAGNISFEGDGICSTGYVTLAGFRPLPRSRILPRMWPELLAPDPFPFPDKPLKCRRPSVLKRRFFKHGKHGVDYRPQPKQFIR